MKKFLCLLLILALAPLTALTLAGCDKDHNIKDFYKSYLNIASNSQNLTLTEAHDSYSLNINRERITINYSQQLTELMKNDTKPYRYIDDFYQKLLDDTLAPLYLFGAEISNSNNVSKKQAEQLFNKLSALESGYQDIDYYSGILMSSLKSSAVEAINLSHLSNLFEQYEQMLDAASDLSALVCDIYFNNILTNSNLNYTNKAYTDFLDADLTNIAINIRSRIYYYKSIYANVYYQLYIKGHDINQKLINTSYTPPVYNPYNYTSGITSLTTTSTQELHNNKYDICINMISLYNIQTKISTAYSHFVTASRNIVYHNVNYTSSITDRNYANIMLHFANGIAYDSYEILSSLIAILYI